jgi:alpha-galactosidase
MPHAALLAILLIGCPRAALTAQTRTAPPNAPASWRTDGPRVRLTYDGATLFDGTLSDSSAELRALVDTTDGVVTQVLKWTVRGGASLTLAGRVAAGDEAFPCEVDRREDGLALIRHSVGLSHSLLNRAVYDRGRDWVVSVDYPAGVTITPADSATSGTTFRLEATGREVALRFRPRFYSRHRGLAQFAPWTYRSWRHSVAGWTSWYAFRDRVTENDIRRTAAVIAETLAPFGYEYVQIDDGYQRTPVGLPDTWLVTNEKFPGGLAGLTGMITAKGLKSGLWTNVSFQQLDEALAHPHLFVRTPDGRPAYGNWIGYVLDGSDATLDTIVRPVYRALRAMGWSYYKVDALRHLRYEGYNSYTAYFHDQGADPVAEYRGVVRAIRNEIGSESFLLASWGVRPELAGLIDACRLGDDGFGYGGFAQYNSFNNVVWRNDPDHVELTERDAYPATMATSLTGSLLMLTDKPEVYRTEVVDAARRAAPVLFTVPGQIYDVDPSRSAHLARAGTELTGSGPRELDAEQVARHHLYLLEVNRPFERWMVLGRTGGDAARIAFADLGLPPADRHVVFEFWSRRFVGELTEGFAPGDIDPRFHAQLFCIRRALDRPQVVATTRHVSCGGHDLEDVAWSGSVLSGVSNLVAGDEYVIVLREPDGFRFLEASAEGAAAASNARPDGLRELRLRPPASGPVTWKVRYAGE